MSYVLLCKGNKALKPYYIEDIRKKIYTLEELCIQSVSADLCPYRYGTFFCCGTSYCSKYGS